MDGPPESSGEIIFLGENREPLTLRGPLVIVDRAAPPIKARSGLCVNQIQGCGIVLPSCWLAHHWEKLPSASTPPELTTTVQFAASLNIELPVVGTSAEAN
ncbi:hypothetical protein [Bradyrhizobium sp. ARR65]|uniref:hypothetical protein n=1 Tax=Bradyrhizobium sp. ARR65 TaxID=1040989 RepID=UPI0012FB91D2|nr:hypothetical protein [Bradyrhizobium sp. ARR65]